VTGRTTTAAKQLSVVCFDFETDGYTDPRPVEACLLHLGRDRRKGVTMLTRGWRQRAWDDHTDPTPAHLELVRQQREAAAVHGIGGTLATLLPAWDWDATPERTILDDLRQADVWLVWSAFDAVLVGRELERRHGATWTRPTVLDVRLWAAAVLQPAQGQPEVSAPRLSSVSLGEACRALGVDHHRPHTALGDVGATWEMVHKLQTLLDGLHGWPIGRRDVLNLDPMLLMRLYQWQLRELRARPDAWQTRSWWPAWLELRP
jgi:hypothetical protein